MSDDTSNDEEARDRIDRHYDSANDCYQVGFEVVSTRFWAHGFGPDSPQLHFLYLAMISSSVGSSSMNISTILAISSGVNSTDVP